MSLNPGLDILTVATRHSDTVIIEAEIMIISLIFTVFRVGMIPWRRAWKPTPVFLPGESPWTEEPGRLLSMGAAELSTTERLST